MGLLRAPRGAVISGLRQGSTQAQPKLRGADSLIAAGLHQPGLRYRHVLCALLRGVCRRDERAEETECGPSLEFFMEGLVTVAA